ncbi:HD domain-containing protein [Treponema primitia]|uniref:HD domain-containing protein n=1 Tax=Treponema primitia TaxID=88058 RepID=UPI0002554F4A|nr:HD domain-containing protein [Treponema primitia]
MRSQKELALDAKILETVKSFGLGGKTVEAVKLVLEDDEVQAMQEYANTVSIMRLNFNDHGPVHMRTVALNALIMMGLLRDAGIKTNLEKEDCGNFDDSLTAVFLAGILHDLGMTIGRQDHELHSIYLAYPILDRLLRKVYTGSLQKMVTVRSLALEGISGHMGSRTIHSLEAGVVQIADGCDMTKGRARIPLIVAGGPRPGDIHQLSANSIEDVRIFPGKEKPIRIEIQMSSEVGLFQIEEVLLAKIATSTAKIYIELYALVDNGEPKRYL